MKYLAKNMSIPSYKLTIAIVVALAISLTPFYGFAYIIAITLVASRISFSKTFNTYLSRLFLAFTLLSISIMMGGLVAWFINISVTPLVVLLSFLALTTPIRTKPELKPGKRIDRGDLISMLLAVIAPAVICFSFYIPHPSNAASYQFLSNGWDNATHILMTETASIEHGYVYGSFDDVGNKTISTVNAYPQAWHLATANLAGGFGINPFDPDNPTRVMSAYIIMLFLWYVCLVYCFSKFSWQLIQKVTGRRTDARKLAPLLVFSVGNLFFQLLIFWGALLWGFANYMACGLYLLIMTSAIFDRSSDTFLESYGLAVIAGSAAILSWFLPLPAVVGSIILAFFGSKTVMKSWRTAYEKRHRFFLACVVLTVLLGLITLSQVAIFIIFAGVSGSEQLAATGTVFSLRKILATIVIGSSLYYWLSRKQSSDGSDIVITILAPVVLLSLVIYVFQIFSGGGAAYYLYKILGLAFMLAGVFLLPGLFDLFMELKQKHTSLAALAVMCCIPALLILGSSQDTINFNMLFQRNSMVRLQTAEKVTSYLASSDMKKTEILILTHKDDSLKLKRSENFNGNLIGKLPHQALTCVNTIVNASTGKSLGSQVRNLDKCSQSIDKRIIVITSPATNRVVSKLNSSNIKTVLVR